MRAVSAKALYILLLSTLLRLQRVIILHEITQGAATLYPGLCAFALTARPSPTWTSELGYSIFEHQTVYPTYFISGAPVPGRKKETRVISNVSNEYAGIDELAEVP